MSGAEQVKLQYARTQVVGVTSKQYVEVKSRLLVALMLAGRLPVADCIADGRRRRFSASATSWLASAARATTPSRRARCWNAIIRFRLESGLRRCKRLALTTDNHRRSLRKADFRAGSASHQRLQPVGWVMPFVAISFGLVAIAIWFKRFAGRRQVAPWSGAEIDRAFSSVWIGS
jgi:hypothetical protein